MAATHGKKVVPSATTTTGAPAPATGVATTARSSSRILVHATFANLLGLLVIAWYTVAKDVGRGGWRDAISTQQQLGALGIITIVVGIPHGAFDPLLVAGDVASG